MIKGSWFLKVPLFIFCWYLILEWFITNKIYNYNNFWPFIISTNILIIIGSGAYSDTKKIPFKKVIMKYWMYTPLFFVPIWIFLVDLLDEHCSIKLKK